MDKGFCEKCNKLVEYVVKEVPGSAEIKGKVYKFIRVVGYCKKCGEEISSEELIDENLNRLDRVFREKEKIISTEEIDSILKKYNIGKKPLSKLLGWGEVTLTRYMNGDVPTKAYSDQLYKLLNDENSMNELIEKNKELITMRAYNNVKNAISNGTSNNYVTTDIEMISEYIIAKGKEITPLALQKILYYAQGFYYVFCGKFLFEDDCQAWVHGPVYIGIYEKYKDYKYDDIDGYVDSSIGDFLTDEKKDVLDTVIKYFGYYNGKALEKMTHFETPWINARKGLLPTDNTHRYIKKEDIKEYFEKIKNKYDMISVLDIKKYSDDQFKRVVEL